MAHIDLRVQFFAGLVLLISTTQQIETILRFTLLILSILYTLYKIYKEYKQHKESKKNINTQIEVKNSLGDEKNNLQS